MTKKELIKQYHSIKNKGIKREIKLQLLGYNKPDYIADNTKATEAADLYKDGIGYQVKSHKASFGLCGYELVGDLLTDLEHLLQADASDQFLFYYEKKTDGRHIYHMTKTAILQMAEKYGKKSCFYYGTSSKKNGGKKSLRIKLLKKRRYQLDEFSHYHEIDTLEI